MNRSKIKDDSLADSRLSKAMKQLPAAADSPWFTRRVLNRLPDRQRRIASYVEMAVCVVGIIITLLFAIKFVGNALQSGVITVGDIVLYAIFVAIIVALGSNVAGYMFIRPVRAMIQRRNGMARM